MTAFPSVLTFELPAELFTINVVGPIGITVPPVPTVTTRPPASATVPAAATLTTRPPITVEIGDGDPTLEVTC